MIPAIPNKNKCLCICVRLKSYLKSDISIIDILNYKKTRLSSVNDDEKTRGQQSGSSKMVNYNGVSLNVSVDVYYKRKIK